jgi:adenosylcobinamide-GDP ribazoletransferase
MVLAVSAFPNARTSGLAARFRAGLGRRQLVVATLMTVGIGVVCGLLIDWRLILIMTIAPITVFIVGRWSAQRLGGGLTGDVYGALCEIVELICLICLNIT